MQSQTLFMLCCTLAVQLFCFVDAAAFLRDSKDKTLGEVQQPAEDVQYISPEVANLLLNPQLVDAIYEQQQQQYRPESEPVETLSPAQKRAQTFVRFGKRAQTFVRFGKRAQTFVRFG